MSLLYLAVSPHREGYEKVHRLESRSLAYVPKRIDNKHICVEMLQGERVRIIIVIDASSAKVIKLLHIPVIIVKY